MSRTMELELTPREAFDEAAFSVILNERVKPAAEEQLNPVKRSIDARGRKVVVRVQVEVSRKEDDMHRQVGFSYNDISNKEEVIIVGAGPAGLFAALRLIELGLKPIVLERGRDVQSRRRDLAAINKAHTVNPESNYCFGEGGAGTYSDGKLYTRSKKRGDVRRILEILVAHGASKDILFDAHPHIGTNKLPKLVTALRETIEKAGGEVRFNNRVSDIILQADQIKGVIVNDTERVEGQAVILATGHSARDLFQLLHNRRVLIELKPFALGVRVEHAQQLIDQIQYHCEVRDPYLPASSYSLVHQAQSGSQQRGVFSFCMCPGGFIVPSATSPGEVVVNGMSPSRRDSRFANSGIVVSVDQRDFLPYERHGALAAMHFQREIEQRACASAGNSQSAPAQRLMDFVDGKVSEHLLETSYQPGLASVDLRSVLPKAVHAALREGFKDFGKKMKGYLTNEAQVIGVESRTSSPVRIPRDKVTLEHPQIGRLFPSGEGAGYAGGIVSAAMDGERCAEAVHMKIRKS